MSSDQKRAYVEAVESFFEGQVALTEEQLAAAEQRVASLSKELVQAVRTVHKARKESRNMQASAGADLEARGREYDEVVQMRGVRAIEVEGARITILTEPIVLEHEGHRFLIGDFSLEVDLNGTITIRNLSNTITKGGWEHPHVQGGMPCLGNVRDGLMKLLGEGALVPLTSILIQFLESYDPETAYSKIESWEQVAP
jgi:hypothetical protein